MDDKSTRGPEHGHDSQMALQVTSLKRTVYVVGVLLVGGMAALAYIGWQQASELSAELAARPPIAIVDVNAIVMEQLSSQPGLTAEQGAVSAYKMGEVLASKGYIVIHKGSIVAYPAEYEVAP